MARRANQYSCYLSDDLSDLLEKVETVWNFRSRADFFEHAIESALMIELGRNRMLSTVVGRAVDSYLNSIKDISQS